MVEGTGACELVKGGRGEGLRPGGDMKADCGVVVHRDGDGGAEEATDLLDEMGSIVDTGTGVCEGSRGRVIGEEGETNGDGVVWDLDWLPVVVVGLEGRAECVLGVCVVGEGEEGMGCVVGETECEVWLHDVSGVGEIRDGRIGEITTGV